MRTITFNELRRIKDSLPSGSMHRIADELNMTVETVRNFFGGHNFKNGKSVGIHLEPGPDGGLVMLDDTTVLEKALQILRETEEKAKQCKPLFKISFHTNLSIIHANIRNHKFGQFPSFFRIGINHSRSHYSLNMVFVINLIKEIIIFVFAFHIRIT